MLYEIFIPTSLNHVYLKQEMYYGKAICSFEVLKKKLEEYINYYNNKRIMQKLASMSPVQYRIHTSQLAA
ncbi:IS3 family transposase [Terrilactibacillus sp. BCM23-1]|uniref:IS3 family transposase n=1 Tax=Terrilactibacillus tamarindi TaxID=2599694 RepID=A0A6N8CM92_9BACI|nr:IS3 family transposase [Terrilactibacillus tamarindi]